MENINMILVEHTLMKSFFKLFLKNEPDAHKIALLYGAIMAQARSKDFFIRFGLSDDFETRFESLILHMLLVMRRLKGEGQEVKQALMDFMVSDLDRTLREMGVGDVGVVKRMKHFMEGFYGRMNAYEAALNSADKKEILRALDRNLYGASSTDLAKLDMMRDYIEAQAQILAAQPTPDILDGKISFKAI
ncbi:MAG: ubiquinol-cytochrome C chaperone family protein [Alphaproteobacteria bacterium]|nr:ubiquinol-cytochrome C chaperone family protein [Alphaproteobacteria bacterium]